MEPINRAEGTTESERYLATLADRTFLDLWSYPNTFKDQGSTGGGDGKEICDLLVVCGDDVIIFSDKSIAWPEHQDINVSWARWYRRAIEKSVDQIRGADRWLRKFPNRVFIDRRCTRQLPIALPPPERIRVHGIAIALGAEEACRKYYGDEDGSLMVVGFLKGKDHVSPEVKGYLPFGIGDVDPSAPFVHVLDKSALDLLLKELDTVSDFTRYLQERENFIRSGDLAFSPGEADLLAQYLHHTDPQGQHKFPRARDFGMPDDYQIQVSHGEFEALLSSREYKAKKDADQISYIWDRLIGAFTEHILAGTSVAISGEEPSAQRAEPALRIMARESRTARRFLGEAFVNALEKARELRQDRYTRTLMPFRGMADPECGYIFMILTYPTKFELEGGYEQYRRARVEMLKAYCAAVLYDNRHLKRMVSIAVDAASEITGRYGGSEDLVAFEVKEWNAALEKSVEEHRKHYDVFDAKRLRWSKTRVEEYPSENPVPEMNRKERRAAAKRARERKRLQP